MSFILPSLLQCSQLQLQVLNLFGLLFRFFFQSADLLIVFAHFFLKIAHLPIVFINFILKIVDLLILFFQFFLKITDLLILFFHFFLKMSIRLDYFLIPSLTFFRFLPIILQNRPINFILLLQFLLSVFQVFALLFYFFFLMKNIRFTVGDFSHIVHLGLEVDDFMRMRVRGIVRIVLACYFFGLLGIWDGGC